METAARLGIPGVPEVEAPLIEEQAAVDELYDVARDPKETQDLSERRPEDLKRLRALADAHLESRPPWGEAPRLELDEMELNNLRALGYKLP